MNFKIYQELLSLSKEAYINKNYEESILFIRIIAKFCSSHDVGILYSEECEALLNAISKDRVKNLPLINLNFIENSRNILHVFTETSQLGGHTRLAKNWIANSFENEIPHVLVLNQDKNELPKFLNDIIEDKNGTILSFKALKTDLEKAEKLRAVSENFVYIVLHIDMHDPIANLAFGHNKLEYPTIFMNHADHIFWLGTTSSQVYAELSISGQEITLLKRNIKNSKVLPIALNQKISTISKSQARDELNLSHDEKIYLSIASSYKFVPDENVDFLEMAKELILSLQNVNARLIVIGPNKDKEQSWKQLYLESEGKIDAIGYVTDQLNLYHVASDVYLDSFPFNSYTATLEPAMLGKPCVILDYGPKRCIDSLTECGFIAKDVPEYIQKAKEFLNYYNEVESKAIIEKFHVSEGWQEYLLKLYTSVNKTNCEKIEIMNKEYIINRFELFSKLNYQSLNKYFFIKNIKYELKRFTLFNKIKMIFLFSKEYNLKNKIRTITYFFKTIL